MNDSPSTPALQISFVISTHNRCATLPHTLEQVRRCGLAAGQFETIVIDNASTDGTTDVVRRAFPDVRLIALRKNLGACGKNAGVLSARGEFLVFLDDDSFPMPGSIVRMIGHFRANPALGVAGFVVTLPDGGQECSAYPDVPIGCGVGLRRAALADVGCLPDDFFMQAEEYDLALRLLERGYRVKSFSDLQIQHLKTPAARLPRRTLRLDVRNNLLLALRHLPDAQMLPTAQSWLARYWRIAVTNRQRGAFLLGVAQGLFRGLKPDRRRPISHETAAHFFRSAQIKEAFQKLRDEAGVRRVLFVDYGKNVGTYISAARNAGLAIVAIIDDRLAGCRCENVPVIASAVAAALEFDAVVVSNSSPAHAAASARDWRTRTARQVIDLLEFPCEPMPPQRTAA